MEFEVDGGTYKRFEGFARTHYVSRDEALRIVLVKGMEAYWPQRFAYMVADYEALKGRFEAYSRDNVILRRIYSRNSELKQLLDRAESAGKGE
ncbi:MAG: hypothetical protein KGI38_09535 [Thaumarchaeota archaeon]|nr:hypothetical protein [Nitrososphaerota archaeon]